MRITLIHTGIRRLLATPTLATSSAAKRWSSQELKKQPVEEVFELDGRQFRTDEMYNVSPAVRRLLDRRILQESTNPLNLLKRRITDYVHQTYRKPGNRSPLFTICESEPRVVTNYQNFDSLLTPADHVSRRSSDTYYVNSEHCLRAHTSAHQHTLMQQGLDAFLVIGDVYRRDEVDRTHYPCFHQIEGVRLYSRDELLGKKSDGDNAADLFTKTPDSERVAEKQETHTLDAVKAAEIQLKQFLESLCDELFGKDAEKRWVDAYFPFTHPSFELEVFYNGQWLEVLGCGIMEQKLLESAGVTDKIGWAFGIGLERIAMVLYGIPDIRLFWSKDTGFLSQFAGKLPTDEVKYKQISAHPQVIFDLSFFLPSTSVQFNDMTSDVYDTIRNVGGELVEQVKLTDEFENKKKGKKSQTYRIVYRSHEKALTKEEVNVVHKQIEQSLADAFGVVLR